MTVLHSMYIAEEDDLFGEKLSHQHDKHAR
jgi:hypothetical protein|eukprot:COSAG01_NODE_3469_length_6050_cov_1.863552_7_plen_30_part_00